MKKQFLKTGAVLTAFSLAAGLPGLHTVRASEEIVKTFRYEGINYFYTLNEEKEIVWTTEFPDEEVILIPPFVTEDSKPLTEKDLPQTWAEPTVTLVVTEITPEALVFSEEAPVREAAGTIPEPVSENETPAEISAPDIDPTVIPTEEELSAEAAASEAEEEGSEAAEEIAEAKEEGSEAAEEIAEAEEVIAEAGETIGEAGEEIAETGEVTAEDKTSENEVKASGAEEAALASEEPARGKTEETPAAPETSAAETASKEAEAAAEELHAEEKEEPAETVSEAGGKDTAAAPAGEAPVEKAGEPAEKPLIPEKAGEPAEKPLIPEKAEEPAEKPPIPEKTGDVVSESAESAEAQAEALDEDTAVLPASKEDTAEAENPEETPEAAEPAEPGREAENPLLILGRQETLKKYDNLCSGSSAAAQTEAAPGPEETAGEHSEEDEEAADEEVILEDAQEAAEVGDTDDALALLARQQAETGEETEVSSLPYAEETWTPGGSTENIIPAAVETDIEELEKPGDVTSVDETVANAAPGTTQIIGDTDAPGSKTITAAPTTAPTAAPTATPVPATETAAPTAAPDQPGSASSGDDAHEAAETSGTGDKKRSNPKTGDTTAPMTYLAAMIASGAAFFTAKRKKRV